MMWLFWTPFDRNILCVDFLEKNVKNLAIFFQQVNEGI